MSTNTVAKPRWNPVWLGKDVSEFHGNFSLCYVFTTSESNNDTEMPNTTTTSHTHNITIACHLLICMSFRCLFRGKEHTWQYLQETWGSSQALQECCTCTKVKTITVGCSWRCSDGLRGSNMHFSMHLLSTQTQSMLFPIWQTNCLAVSSHCFQHRQSWVTMSFNPGRVA